MVDVNFYAAGGPASGEEVFNIDTATFDHFGFFGPSGRGDRIGIGEAQDFTRLASILNLFTHVVSPFYGLVKLL